MTHVITFKTPWGWVEIAASPKGIAAIDLSPSTRRASTRPLEGGKDGAAAALVEAARSQLLAYIEGTRREFSVPVDMAAGTTFQRKVWKAIARIPYGRVRSISMGREPGGREAIRSSGRHGARSQSGSYRGALSPDHRAGRFVGRILLRVAGEAATLEAGGNFGAIARCPVTRAGD